MDACDYLVVRAYKKDRFERFLDFLMANIMILRGLCIIAYVFCKLAEKVTEPSTALWGLDIRRSTKVLYPYLFRIVRTFKV